MDTFTFYAIAENPGPDYGPQLAESLFDTVLQQVKAAGQNVLDGLFTMSSTLDGKRYIAEWVPSK